MEMLFCEIVGRTHSYMKLLLSTLQNFISELFSYPKGMYSFWKPNIIWLHAISDFLIALAYLAIPAGIYFVMKKRKDLQRLKPIFVLFIAFTLLCGLNHIAEVYTIWDPAYQISGFLKALNAIVSIATAVVLWPLLPHILKLPSPTDLQVTNQQLQDQIEERIRTEKELQLHKDNLEHMVDARTKDLENATQKLTSEIRDRKEAQEKVQFQASLLDQVNSAIVATNLEDEIVYWNKSAENLFGWKASEVLGKRTIDVLVSYEQVEQIKRIFRMLHTTKKWEGEINLLHKEGHKIPVHIIDSVLKDQSGEEIGYAFVSFDISNHIKSEEKLQKAKEQAERTALAKQDFLSTMSHEIRTPLNVIIGMTRLLLESQPKDEQMDYLKSLQFSANHLLVIINDILDFSKIEAGKIKLEEISFSIPEVLTGIGKAFSFKAQEKNIALNIHADPSLPQRVIGDQVRLTQILNNLVGNAIKFTEEGFVSVHVKLLKGTQKNLEVQFEVRDTGIGIETSKVKNIFDSFTQAKADTTRKFGGTGLGLTICKKLVELQGGRIWVKSKEGVGSTFGFQLSYQQDTSKESKTTEEKQYLDKSYLKGFRLLLVEDNPSNQMVASNFLDKVGIHVDYADNGSKALELVQHKNYDIILMDLQMPVMDGFIATREIRKLGGRFAKIPIIALTADVVLDVKERVYQSGMNDYLSKPFNPDELYLKIAKNLNLPIDRQTFHVQNNEEVLSLLRIVEEYSNDTQFVTALLDSLKTNFAGLSGQIAELAHQKDLYNLRKVIHKQMPSIRMVENHSLKTHLDKLKNALAQEYIEEDEIDRLLDAIRVSAFESVRFIESLFDRIENVPDGDSVAK